MALAEEWAWRLGRIRRAMAEAELEGLLSYAAGWRQENVRYLTGAPLRGSFGLVYLPAVGSPTAWVTHADDVQAIRQWGWIDDVRPLDLDRPWVLGERLSEGGRPQKLGLAHRELMPRVLYQAVQKALPHAEVVSATRLMDRVRMVKSAWELEQMRRAGTVADAGWRAFVEAVRPGVREYEVVAAVESVLKRLGAGDNFMLIASGKEEVMGMTPPGNRALERGDMVRTELTPALNGYFTQICRTVVVGVPNDRQQRSHALFREALEAGLAAVRAGVTADAIARAENDVFRKYDLGQYCTSQYTRVRGHGLGLHPDDVPQIVEGNETVLEEHAVVVIHPNTYTPWAGYHVLGDPVVVTKEGCEPLLTTERVLFAAPV
ncbi:MAG: Xaa-Pro peptidase family protein [Firmicutes bacterium]|nr:aminopeptidase P family protein [Alicyclobacillaceae bacterium]MCL6497618.1 Xaa-Pro peptidase family protein [Bacillota bacterium]